MDIDLADQPFITISRDRSASFYDHVLTVCAAAGFAPRIVQEASELFTVVSLVRAGLGVALVPRSTALARLVPRNSLKPRSLRPEA